MLELNKIHCGDNCDLLGQLPRECIDLVVTSPPYDDLRAYGGHSWDFFGVATEARAETGRRDCVDSGRCDEGSEGIGAQVFGIGDQPGILRDCRAADSPAGAGT